MGKITNSVERIRRAINGEPLDYYPAILIALGVACELTHTKQRNYSTCPDVMADCLIKCADMTCGVDGIYVSRDNAVIHQAMGGEMVFPENAVGMKVGNILENIKDFEKLSVPDFETAPGSSTVIKAARKVVEEVGNKYYVMANIDSGPFSTAASLRGIQNFMMDIVTEDESLLKEYLDFCNELVVSYGKAMQKTGVKGIQYGESPASLISPELFEKYAFPYIQKSSKALCHKDVDFWLHICGNSKHLLPLLAVEDLNVQVFEVDAIVDLAEAHKLLESKMALKGNLDTMFISSSTTNEVYNATREMIKESKLNTSLIVSAGCEIPRETPLENIKAMINACQCPLY